MALQAPDDAAVIVYCEGLIKANGQQVDIGSRIADGTTLITGPDAFAEIVFAQKNILKIGPGSIIKLQLSTLQRRVDLEMGTVGAVLRRLDKAAGGSLTVHTPTAIAGVRGTTFFSQVDADKPAISYYCICNGKLELSDAEGNHLLPVQAPHHLATILEQTASGQTQTSGTMVGHDDPGIEALADRIGETMDWSKVEE